MNFLICTALCLCLQVFAWSASEKEMRDDLLEKFGHSDIEQKIVNLLIDDILTGQIDTIPISEIRTIVAFSFGHRVLPNGNHMPGPVNEELADLVVKLQRQSGAHVYAQWEIAEAIGERIPDNLLTAIQPALNNKAQAVYLSTLDVAKKIKKLVHGKTETLGKVAIIGFHDHIQRCIEMARYVGIEAYAPEGYQMPLGYDELSGQPWTCDRLSYLEHELRKRLQMISK